MLASLTVRQKIRAPACVRIAVNAPSATAVGALLRIARLWYLAAATAVTPLPAPAGTVHWPTSLLPLQPQAITLPSLFSAKLWRVPAATAVTPLPAPAGTVHCPESVPLPQPQAITLPSLLSATLWNVP